jgi:hypothetical protein
VGSVSLACLSCHDGTQSMDVVINAPGSGGWVATGTAIDGGTRVMTNSPVPLLGTDLTNDHPISMQFAAGGPIDTDADGVFARTGYADTDFRDVNKATINGQPIWWVDSDAASDPTGATGNATREKTDMLLYTRAPSDTGLANTQPFVECASCHDPHNDVTKVANQDPAFMRISNAASAICTTCHLK